MFVFDLSHDRMASDPVAMVSDVQQAVILEEGRYAQAARKIGLTGQEFAQFEARVLLGDLHHTTLPTHIDAMAGMHRGSVYAVRNVRVREGQLAYVVTLPGKRVYVPVVCGNLSVVRTPRVVTRVIHPTRRSLPHGLVPSRTHARALSLATPAADRRSLPVTAAPQPPPPAPAPASAVARRGGFAIPFFAWLAGIGGLVGGTSGGGGGGGGGFALPSCNGGHISDAGACAL